MPGGTGAAATGDPSAAASGRRVVGNVLASIDGPFPRIDPGHETRRDRGEGACRSREALIGDGPRTRGARSASRLRLGRGPGLRSWFLRPVDAAVGLGKEIGNALHHVV